MDVREELVELLSEIIDGGFKWHNYLYESGEQLNNDDIASFLIANGVTVQEWVSVDDRLPQDDSDVLAYLSIGEESRICPANYAKGVWFDCIFDMPVTESVTHWMPLPKLPKGE